MIDAANASACRTDEPHCITCGDEGIPMVVIATDGSAAICDGAEGGRQQVAVDLVAPVHAGDQVLVHAGVAISRLGAATR